MLSTSSSILRKSTTLCRARLSLRPTRPHRFSPSPTHPSHPLSLPTSSIKRYKASFAQIGESIKPLEEGEDDEEETFNQVEQGKSTSSSSNTTEVSRIPTLSELIDSTSSSSSSSSDGGGPTIQDVYSIVKRKRLSIPLPSASSPDSHRTIYKRYWEEIFNKLFRAFSKRQLFELCLLPKPLGFEIDVENDKQVLNKLRLGTRTSRSKSDNKPKWWKPKKLQQMNKRELCQTLLIVEFELVQPETLPLKSNKSFGPPEMIESLPLNDRCLFLLLSPNCPVIPRIANHLQVKVSFARDPKTRILSIVLSGSRQGVSDAKSEIETIDDHCETKLFKLPKPRNSLKPEVYQTISRLAKTFLEPVSDEQEQEDMMIKASAIEPKNLKRLQRYLSSAFATDSIRQESTLQYLSSSTRNDSCYFSLLPFQPISPSSQPGQLTSLSGTTSTFARLKEIKQSHDDDELETWSEKMRFNQTRMTRIPIKSPSTNNNQVSILDSLLSPFKVTSKQHERGGGVKYQLSAEFGHLVFPLYKEAGTNKFGPSSSSSLLREGKLKIDEWLEWLKRNNKNETIWIPDAPKGFFESTGVTNPLNVVQPSSSLSSHSSSPSSPFSALFSNPTPSPSPPPSALERDSDRDGGGGEERLSRRMIESLNSLPTFESKGFRRLIYYPSQLPSTSTSTSSTMTMTTTDSSSSSSSSRGAMIPSTRLEIILDNNHKNEKDSPPPQVSVSLIRETKLEFLLPNREKDLRLNLQEIQNLDEKDLKLDLDSKGGGESSTFKLKEGTSSLFETLATSPSQSPFELIITSPGEGEGEGEREEKKFFLHSTSLIRQTKIKPPLLLLNNNSSNNNKDNKKDIPRPRSSLEQIYPIVQETIHNFLPENGVKINTVEYILADTSTKIIDDDLNGDAGGPSRTIQDIIYDRPMQQEKEKNDDEIVSSSLSGDATSLNSGSEEEDQEFPRERSRRRKEGLINWQEVLEELEKRC